MDFVDFRAVCINGAGLESSSRAQTRPLACLLV